MNHNKMHTYLAISLVFPGSKFVEVVSQKKLYTTQTIFLFDFYNTKKIFGILFRSKIFLSHTYLHSFMTYRGKLQVVFSMSQLASGIKLKIANSG